MAMFRWVMHKNNKQQLLCALIVCIVSMPCYSVFQPGEQAQINQYCEDNPSVCKERERFRSYQPNYAIWQQTDGDEDSLEAHYSFRYLFSEPDCMTPYRANRRTARETLKCIKKHNRRKEFFFTFTGEFDFYVSSRDSGPVINRISNPALHFRKYLGKSTNLGAMSLRWLDLGLEHRSNGQVVEADVTIDDPGSADFGRFRTQVEFESNNHEYFDALSRSANYLSIEGKFQVGKYYDQDESLCDTTAKCMQLYVSVKPFYSNVEADVTWGSLANTDVTFSDYDRLRIIAANKFADDVELSLEWTIGDEGFDTDSININLGYPISVWGMKLPLYIRYHHGPMNTLSDYTREQNAWGIGLRFR